MEEILLEIWKDCFGYEDSLQISNLGNIHSKDRIVNSGKGTRVQNGTPRKLGSDKDGYLLIIIGLNGKSYTEKVHRLVLKTFQPIKNQDELQVNHKDGNKSNNKLDNLEWVTPKENVAHAIETGLMYSPTDYYVYRGSRIGYKGKGHCPNCKKSFKKKKSSQKFCKPSCYRNFHGAAMLPSRDELYKELCETANFSLLSKKYGVSDNALRKWCDKYNIPRKSSYYVKMKSQP